MHHYALIEHLEGTELQQEQETLDDHDDEISVLTIRIQQLIALCASSSASDFAKLLLADSLT